MYKVREKDDQPVIDQLNMLTDKHQAIGFWMCYHRIRRQDNKWNPERVYRGYTAMKLNIRRNAKRRLLAKIKQQQFQLSAADQVWSMDFMYDTLWKGKHNGY